MKKPNSRLPEVSSKEQAVEALKLLALNQLAFQVNKLDTEVAVALSQKPRAGVPCLQINHNQQFEDDMYICWFYEQPIGLSTYLYASSALIVIFAIVLFPLWPFVMRLGVWYVSMGFLGLIAAFFGIAIIRLVFFLATYVAISPGIWIFPNLFEDVGVIDSFIPYWAWNGADSMAMHRPKKRVSKKKKQEKLKKEQLFQDQVKAKREAENDLMLKIEGINAKIKAITEEREKTGDPMDPTEMAQLGQRLFAEELGATLHVQEEEDDGLEFILDEDYKVSQ